MRLPTPSRTSWHVAHERGAVPPVHGGSHQQQSDSPTIRQEPRGGARAAAHALARDAAQCALAKKATDVIILHVGDISPVADFFVLATGNTDTQVRAIADEIEEQVRVSRGDKPWHVEGLQASSWVLMDYVDVVVHIFQPAARDYYMLERLWGDARREVAVDVARRAAPDTAGSRA